MRLELVVLDSVATIALYGFSKAETHFWLHNSKPARTQAKR
jgi:hypothetical protein